MRSDAGTAHGFRNRPLGKVVILGVLLVAAFLVARGCNARSIQIDKDEAVVIAKEAVDFEAGYVQVRAQRRGLNSRVFWLVGLSERRPDGTDQQCVNLLIDAKSGEIAETRLCPT